ncbi:MAG: hypothetical protein JNM90_00505 [Burkholderiales bacterium]|nr:hypothetical protein [Burkholderiales bacterium]
MSAARRLRELEALRLSFGPAAAANRRALIDALDGARFARADLLARYHEALCFSAAYPDDRVLLARVRAALRGFPRRADLARFRDALADSGIAGTATHYNYFWMKARWLAVRFPRRFRINWDAPEFEARLRAALPLFLPWHQAEAVKRSSLPLRRIIDRLRGGMTDAAFLARALEGMSADGFAREHLHDSIDAAFVLAPGHGFPSRTLARHARAPIAWRRTPPPAGRPDLVAELARAPRGVRRAGRVEGRALVERAREAMLTRARDLAAFSWGDEREVLVVDDGDGLAFALIGSLPERRLPLPVVHGWLMLRNQVPVGYVQTDCLLAGAEVSFNVFPTFRGAEAGHLFARVLATARHVLGARAFSIEPYQLGEGNSEGIASGAWWFYYKLGFRPTEPEPQRVLARELARLRRDPAHRSSQRTLEALARGHMVFQPEAGRRAWLPLVPGLGLARRWMAPAQAAVAADRRFGVRDRARWPADERLAWERLAPFLAALGGVESWSAAERRAAVTVLRAKGGPREIDFLRGLDAHAPLHDAFVRLLRAGARPARGA